MKNPLKNWRKAASSGIVALATTAFMAAVVPAAHATTFSYQLHFYKSTADHTNGHLDLIQINVDTGRTTNYRLARAGSGTGTNAENSCVKNQGWLPNGTYTVVATYKNHTGTVTGPAIQLSNKACSSGTLRTELFIHSNYPWSSSHYNSNGCIKVSSTGTAASPGGDILNVYNNVVNHHIKTVVVS
jgi:hypothetical protein